MPFVRKKAPLVLSEQEQLTLEKISKSRTESKTKVERAIILLCYSENKSTTSIAKMLNTNRPKVDRCIDRALEFGVLTALNDLPRKGRPAKITREARAWFLSIACMKPKDLGFASEFWTNKTLSDYIRSNCESAGHSCLIKISRGTVSKILSRSDIKPHKIYYYLQRKDPNFDIKMFQVLHVYKEVELFQLGKAKDNMVAYLSYDEKPGIQAIENIAPDLNPVPKTYSTWKRDYEYKRHGTISLLASIDLLNGDIYGKVFDRHRSKEFIDYLRYVDKIYQKDFKIKMILDNHSAHISKETRKFLKTVPGRFEFIFTPTHASWLNLIEVFFSKMTRTFLKGIRVKSKEELKERVYQYLDEINRKPTVFTWKWKMEDIIIG